MLLTGEETVTMAEALILEFDGVGQKEYEAVNKELGIDMTAGTGNWPPGLLMHAAGVADDGSFVVTEVWESRAAQERFMSERLGQALGKGGVTSPPKAKWARLLAHHHPSSS